MDKLTALLILISGCSQSLPGDQPDLSQVQGCTKDTDCLDGRVCDQRQCVWPNLPDGGFRQPPPDLSQVDLTSPPGGDAGTLPDLTMLPDLTNLPDLTVVRDLDPPPADLTLVVPPQGTPCDPTKMADFCTDPRWLIECRNQGQGNVIVYLDCWNKDGIPGGLTCQHAKQNQVLFDTCQCQLDSYICYPNKCGQQQCAPASQIDHCIMDLQNPGDTTTVWAAFQSCGLTGQKCADTYLGQTSPNPLSCY